MFDIVKKWQHRKNNLFPGDEILLQDRYSVTFESAEEYIQSPMFDDPSDNKFHLGLHPIPYVGNLKKASVYILSLNPGLHLGDYFALSHLYYQDLIHRNFSQQTMDFPVYFLDPKIGFHMGYDYWIGKFRELREELCKITLESRLRIQKFLSQEIALLELIPYHSKRKQVNKPILSLPSVRWMKQFVKTELVPKARSDEKLIFIMRALKNWNLPDHPNILKSKNPRNPSINPNKPDRYLVLLL